MLQMKIGLVDTTGTVDAAKMAEAAAAINTQVTRDLPQFWNINASVSYLPHANQIPQGFWPVLVVDTLPPDEGGFHLTKHNQPYAKVVATPGSDEWTVDASHETLEMLVDPSGNRLQTSTSIEITKGKIADGVGTFEYLVEVCDPCEADSCTYQINGISVSDFITPHFYDLHAAPDARFSFNGSLKTPRQILPGGYISWIDPATNRVKQLLYLDPKPVIKDLGPADGASLRAFVDSKTRAHARSLQAKPTSMALGSRKTYQDYFQTVALARAKHYE
jgi:hypothetical protein